MRPQVIAITLAAASANNIALSQSAAGAQDLTLNGSTAVAGVATLDHQRRVLITSAGNDSGITFTVYGTRKDGGPISEVVTGPNATTAATTQDFYTVNRVATSAATAGNVTIGTNGVGSSGWQSVSRDITPFAMSFAVIVAGTVNFTVQYTYDDPNAGSDGDIQAYPLGTKVPTAWDLTALAAKTANTEASIGSPTLGPINAWRITMNSGSGTATATATQAGNPQ